LEKINTNERLSNIRLWMDASKILSLLYEVQLLQGDTHAANSVYRNTT
jgi:hypothetical protein